MCRLFMILLLLAGGLAAQERVKAPPLSGGTGWINVDRAIDLDDLAGRVVLLDFWTFC